MLWILVLALAVVTAVAAGLAWRLRSARRRIDALERARIEPASDERIRDVITVEIRNHAAVAASRHRLARAVAAVSPGTIRSIVHKEASRIMRDELAANGVDAEVTIRRMAVPVSSAVEPVAAPAPVDPESHDRASHDPKPPVGTEPGSTRPGARPALRAQDDTL